VDKEPAAGILWRSRTTTVERHVTLAERHMSISLCVSEVATVASAETTGTTASTGADLELGAHVARMRTLAPLLGPPRGGRSPISPSTSSRTQLERGRW
jgi:hypothetical protein